MTTLHKSVDTKILIGVSLTHSSPADPIPSAAAWPLRADWMDNGKWNVQLISRQGSGAEMFHSKKK